MGEKTHRLMQNEQIFDSCVRSMGDLAGVFRVRWRKRLVLLLCGSCAAQPREGAHHRLDDNRVVATEDGDRMARRLAGGATSNYKKWEIPKVIPARRCACLLFAFTSFRMHEAAEGLNRHHA